MKPRVLYVVHNHPANRPGGAELYVYELYRAVRDRGEFDATFVARTGPPEGPDEPPEGTRFALVSGAADEYEFFTRREEFDRVLWSAYDKRMYTEEWAGFLRALEPDIVHFQHTARLGYDVIRETRRTLPQAPIVYKLSDFVPICHHRGQMLRTGSHALCDRASAHRCHQCFPKLSPQTFFLRERFVKAAFELVDLFIAPSEFIRGRYIDWGLAPEKIVYEPNGLPLSPPLPEPPGAGRRMRFAFFGQATRFKGLDVLLEAMRILAREDAGARLEVRAANLDLEGDEFQDKIRRLLEQTSASVTFAGPYGRSELPALMSAVDWVIVPSIWWENAPLVITEAMMYRRPVICSDIGGMAELVREGVNGLRFRAGDPYSLADTIRRAIGDPELWDELHGQIAGPHPMYRHLDTVTKIYKQLLAGRKVAA